MIQQSTYEKTWRYLHKESLLDRNIYVEKNQIPLGTKRPFYAYPEDKHGKRIIPEEEIVYLKFDPINKPFTERNAFNILVLGGSGDGKSLLMKNIWWFLHEAGFFCLYFDPKSTDAGRAKIAWHNNRIAPNIAPKGIKLKHYIPVFATRNYQHLIHNFYVYSLRLSQIDQKEMWLGLGCTNKGASKIAKLVQKYGEHINLEKIKKLLFEMYEQKEINAQAMQGMDSILIDLEDYDVINEQYETLQMLEDFKEGYSIVLSYNSCSYILMSFDIGLRIYTAMRYYFNSNNRNPIFFFLDDSSYYAKEKKELLKFNFAINEIKNIGFNYRSLGISSCLAVQTLGIIDENVSEVFKVKIITPSFNNPDSLKQINIPKDVIQLIQDNKLMVDRDMHINEYAIVFPDNTWTRFFPFLPSCLHFEEVYKEKNDKRIP